jgi:hypothetical protein
MAQARKWDQYVSKMTRYPGFTHPAYGDRITQGSLIYDKIVTPVAPAHIEVFQINKPGTGMGTGTHMGPVFPYGEKKGLYLDDNPHWHPVDECFLYHGSVLDKPGYLGGEIEFWMGEGKEAEKYTITEPSVVYVPAGVIHVPIFFNKVDSPATPIFMIVLYFSGVYMRFDSKEFPPTFTHKNE